MSRGIAWIVGLILIVGIGGAAYSVYQRLELVESIEKISLEGEAKKNPLYAARIFLNRMGISAKSQQSLQGLKQLPDSKTVLLISSARSTLSRQAVGDLYAWVRSGGHLIVRVNAEYDYGDYLSDEETKATASGDQLQLLLKVKAGDELSITDNKPFELVLKGSQHPLMIEADDFYPIVNQHASLSSSNENVTLNDAVFLLRRHINHGMITLVADLDFIDNRQIRKADHAEILWQLVHGLSTPNGILLIHNDEMPALWEIMWKHGWALIMTLTLMFVLWLYRVSHRFGPMIPKASEDRRSLLEHIASSGHFYWKHQQKVKLIASTREALQQRLAATQSGWLQLSDAEKIKQLAVRLERPDSEIQQLLFDPSYGLKKNQSDEFTQLVKQLEQIRISL